VRCREGLSHHPDEFAAPEDIVRAIDVLAAFIEEFSA
jgi:allantoate deiminase